MRIVDFSPNAFRHGQQSQQDQPELFGSSGLTLSPLTHEGTASVVVVELAAGGIIGRHDAIGRQLFAVLVGEATVSGSDSIPATIGPGRAALWEAGESHATRSVTGITAVIVEGDFELPEERA